MSDLLNRVVAAHGGADRWTKVKSITAEASITGALWDIKRAGAPPREVRFEVDTTREFLKLDYIEEDKQSVFEPHRVVIEHQDGTLIDSRDDPEKSFDGHQFETPWDELHVAYFLGEALWTYLTIPFLYNRAGFVTDEITPIEVGGETWRRLQATFPDRIKSHTRQQTSCFGPDGLLRRHDFTIDVMGGAPGRLNATDYRDVGGIIIPTTRRAYEWRGDHELVTQPPIVAIDISEIGIS